MTQQPPTQSEPTDQQPQLAAEVSWELRHQLSSLSAVAQWAILPLILLTVSSLWQELPQRPLSVWFSTALLLAFIGFFNNRINRHNCQKGHQDYSHSNFEWRNMLYFSTVGLVWGALPLLAAFWGTEKANWYALIISLAFVTALVLILSTSHRIFFCALLPSGLLILISLFSGPIFSIQLLLLATLYLAALLMMHHTLFQIHLERVSSSVRNAAQVTELANTIEFHDSMTGLFNKNGLVRWLSLYPWSDEEYRPVTLVLANIKGLSEINVLYGSETVDALLSAVATQLLHQSGDKCCLARLSGAEFLLVDAQTGASPAELTRILTTLEHQTFNIADRKVNISIQQSAVQGKTEELDQLIEIARSYLQTPGVECSSVQPDSTTRLNFRRALVMGFHEALQTGRINAWFQPIIDCNARFITGWEALARWQHPTLGTLPPEEFLDIARISGHASALTQMMFLSSVQFISKLLANGHHFAAHVSINFTASDLASPATPVWINDILQEYKIDPALLCIEISEQEALLQDTQFSDNLCLLKQLGISLAIDDFGTGYANLSQLLNLPATTIKLDKCFVEKLPDDKHSVALVKAIITMASSLDMRTVAEGVEREEQLRFLQEQGCNAYQGFLSSMPLSESKALLLTGNWYSNTNKPDQQADTQH